MKIAYDYVDKYGNKKERLEPYQKMFEYAKRLPLHPSTLHDIETTYKEGKKEEVKFSWRLSNTQDHKILFSKQNTRTCQSN